MQNYKLLRQKNIDSMGIEVFLYQHIKTRASLTYVKSSDKNKTFAIAFKTPPNNSKGMAHIMEHSVLNGSKKYKTKEPFMDMISSSLQTFLNAMTYPDKTVFPVSSENDKDFFNLTDVYLDAVFNPRVVNTEEIFLQEGWHYEIKEDDSLDISGVVYNEMKGALTDSDTIIYNDIVKYLYKNSPYEFISGGDPFEIAKLSYQEFIDFYQKYYHPSNSRIYLYGDMDIDFYLEYIDKEYLSKYEYKYVDTDIKVIENIYDEPIQTFYPVSKIEENSDHLSYSFLLKDLTSLKDALTLNIVSTVLFNLDSSEISNKVYSEINPEAFYARTGYGKASMIIQAQKTSEDKLDRFVEIIEEGIEKASNKISKEALRAAFSILDFSSREQMNSTTRGLEYFLMTSLYIENNELEVFEIVEILDELKELIDSNYYEDFVKKYFINNKSKLVLVAKASEAYSLVRINEQKKEIEAYKASLSKEEFEAIREKQKRLENFQNRDNTEEEKSTIPKLDIEDIDSNIEKIPRLVDKDKYEFIFHEYETAGMIYVSNFFDINEMTLEELKYVQLLGDFIGAVDTENHTYGQLDNIIWTYMGSFTTNIVNLRIKDKIDTTFKMAFRTTKDNMKEALKIIEEIIKSSKFDSKKRILEILKQRKTSFEMGMYDTAHIIAMNRNTAHFDKLSYIKEELNGLSYYLFVKDIIKNLDSNFESFKKNIETVYKKVFSQNVSINLSSSKKDYYYTKEEIKKSFASLPEKEINYHDIEFKKLYKKEAILSDANVNYVSLAADLKDFGLEYSSRLSLASSIISNPYLYQLIRAKAGAYGAGLTIDKFLNFASYSYRDPNIELTIENFGKIPEITKNLNLSERDFINQKISKIGSYLKPKSPSQKSDMDYVNYKKGLDEKEIEKFIEDIKSSSLEDIKNYSEVFEKAIQANNITVFGNREQIKENLDFFDSIIDLND